MKVDALIRVDIERYEIVAGNDSGSIPDPEEIAEHVDSVISKWCGRKRIKCTNNTVVNQNRQIDDDESQEEEESQEIKEDLSNGNDVSRYHIK